MNYSHSFHHPRNYEICTTVTTTTEHVITKTPIITLVDVAPDDDIAFGIRDVAENTIRAPYT
jgi:hypothetical protein